MKIIIKFEGSNEVFKKALNKEVNGFINQCLGKDNPYHGNFSRYCISSMQGGRMNKFSFVQVLTYCKLGCVREFCYRISCISQGI